MYDGFDEGNLESVLATMADDVEWAEPDGSIYAGTYDSPTELLENVFKPAMGDFEAFEVQADRFIDGGDTHVSRKSVMRTCPVSAPRF